MAVSFVVSPMIEKIALKAGEIYRGSITVANPKSATEDFYYKISLSPYSVIGEDYTADFETMSDWSRIVEWTTLEDTEGVLKPNETKKIYYRIAVPENAPAGGQYLKIGVTSNGAARGEGVQDVYEMASLVLVSIDGETKHEGQILGTEIPGFVASGKPNLTYKFTNEGNVHETATTKVVVKNVITGEIVYPKENEENLQEFVIMPESTRVVSRELGTLPPLGVFEVNETVSYMGNEISPSIIMIVCPVWFILLMMGLILSIVSMIFYGKHLKKKKVKKELHSEKTNGKIEP